MPLKLLAVRQQHWESLVSKPLLVCLLGRLVGDFGAGCWQADLYSGRWMLLIIFGTYRRAANICKLLLFCLKLQVGNSPT